MDLTTRTGTQSTADYRGTQKMKSKLSMCSTFLNAGFLLEKITQTGKTLEWNLYR